MSAPVNRPRVRFAPAPTGYLHVGGARSALFNWLFARKHGGIFVLRIEDTNPELNRPELIDAIVEPLRWLGIDWDEGPYHQSDRGELYADAISRLLDAGSAYFCDCTRDEIDARARARGGKPGYDGHCRDRRVVDGDGVVVRVRTPDQGETVIDDVVRGTVSFANAELEDFVVRRSDGTPVFLVANAVDDADMRISHVIRGEDLLNTTPKVLIIWRALALGPEPVYAHLPLLVNEQRKKLSKRRDDVAMGDYMERGFLPEAMVNYLATLGWGAPDGVEIRPIGEIVELFDLADVSKGSAFFDTVKLEHFNAEYIRALPVGEFVERTLPFCEGEWPPERFDREMFEGLAPLVQERVRLLSETPNFVDWLFLPDPPDDPESWNKVMLADGAPRPLVAEVLAGASAALAGCSWDAATIEAEVRRVGDELGAKSQVPVRVAVTGRRVGLPLFEPMVMLGREESIRRIDLARDRLGG